MMRSMFSGVSGLKTHQTRMDVIGNNIANVNTVGFKAGRVTFQEIFSQTLKGSSSPNSETGRAGTNPMQVGLGVGISSIDTLMTRGSSQRTDNPTDLAIEGDGFFIVKGSNSDTYKFTRAGNFGIDEIGNLNLNGYGVCGWEPELDTTTNEYKYDTNKAAAPLNLYRDYTSGKNKLILGASPTTSAYLAGNLNASMSTTDSYSVPMNVYDSIGNEYKVNISFQKNTADATGTTWDWTLPSDIKGSDGTTVIATFGGTTSGQIKFTNTGVPDTTTIANFKPTIQVQPAATAGAKNMDIKLDLTSMTMYANSNSVKPTDVNGYPPGTLVTFNVGGDGIITGVYSNGQQQPLGMVGLAVFANPGGMTKAGDNLYIPSTNSGEYTKGVTPGSDGSGMLNPGTLEMSNVDLSKEFTEMIVTQRGFQANSRIITTSDEMLQELVNLKR